MYNYIYNVFIYIYIYTYIHTYIYIYICTLWIWSAFFYTLGATGARRRACLRAARRLHLAPASWVPSFMGT